MWGVGRGGGLAAAENGGDVLTCSDMFFGPKHNLIKPGTYRLVFDTGAYNPAGFFPEATIVFRIDDVAQHYHVPLLLSPFGYSTYRGS